jgi:hypothetical protein
VLVLRPAIPGLRRWPSLLQICSGGSLKGGMTARSSFASLCARPFPSPGATSGSGLRIRTPTCASGLENAQFPVCRLRLPVLAVKFSVPQLQFTVPLCLSNHFRHLNYRYFCGLRGDDLHTHSQFPRNSPLGGKPSLFRRAETGPKMRREPLKRHGNVRCHDGSRREMKGNLAGLARRLPSRDT